MITRTDAARFPRTSGRIREENAVARARQSDELLGHLRDDPLAPRRAKMKETYEESTIAIEALRVQRLQAHDALRDIEDRTTTHITQANAGTSAAIRRVENDVVRHDQRTRALKALAAAQAIYFNAILDGQQDSGLEINKVAGRSPIPVFDPPEYRDPTVGERLFANVKMPIRSRR